MNGLNIIDLTKTFTSLNQKNTALQKINLTVKQKEFFVLLGPSGCGKSTLLNLCAGLEQPTNGEIVCNGTVFSSVSKKIFLSPRERNVAMVFQNYALYPHMTVAENIAFPLKIKGIAKAERVSMVKEAAKMLQLENMLNAKPYELSGGQRQRVAIARAIVRKPTLFLLDEPLSNLDAQLRTYTRNSLKMLQQHLGITTIYVTHDQVEAMTLGDRIALLNKGQIEQVGSPAELYDNPQSTFVAKFIGSPPMNILQTSILRESEKFWFNLWGIKLAVPEQVDKQVLLNQKCLIGIRPEHISLCEESDSGSCRVKVNGIERLGRETIIYAECGNETVSFFSGSVTPELGDYVNIRFNQNRIHVFPA
jgi:multiple sugar transport system ATP-binding protein